jgi:hypothetical protein
MNFLRNLFGRKEAEGNKDATLPNSELSTPQLVEDVVKGLRQKPPSKVACYVVLFGDRPLTGKATGDEGDIMCFMQRSKADDFIRGYQNYYFTEKPLSVLAIGHISDLWALLNNNAEDTLYEKDRPYGLLINFSYSGQPYSRFSVADLNRIGLEGLKKGLSMLS